MHSSDRTHPKSAVPSDASPDKLLPAGPGSSGQTPLADDEAADRSAADEEASAAKVEDE